MATQGLSNQIINFVQKVLEQYHDNLTNQPLSKITSQISIHNSEIYFSISTKKENAEHYLKIKEIITQKLKKADIIAHISLESEKNLKSTPKEKQKTLPPFVKKIILIASGKGGVGKSTIAFNTAITLAKQGYKVGLLDADIHGPSVPVLSGIFKAPVLEGDLAIPHKKFGIHLMSVGYLVDSDKALVWRGPMTSKMLYQLIMKTKWGTQSDELDYLIIDTPPGTSDVHLSLAENYHIDGAIIISTNQKVAISDVQKSCDMFAKLHIPILGIAVNFSNLFGSSNENELLAKNIKSKIITHIDFSNELNQASDNAKPITYYDTTNSICESFKTLAELIAQ